MLLPAHAQTSEPTGSPVGCVVTVAVTLSPSGPFGYTAEVVARDSNFVTTTLNSSVFPSSSAVLSGSTFLPPGDYDGIFAVTYGGSQPWSFTFGLSCCETFSEFQLTESSTVTSFGTGLGALVGDDGTCQIIT